ncbi:exocyst complex component SEC3A-like isoform X1 [Senna tora]|uniref:Exocyst complex component SEC3A-like isoform X1 n=1 Tax=Senna tora TaxID=362788 RepID=A0A834T5X1_9FABA|nr:exocyst complex component SEC3A-like isoform X1 [Senna tora]
MLIPMVNPMLTCSSNHRKKISSYGYIVGVAEAFSERLKKELQPLEAANVHAILESEPMIDEAQSFNLPTVNFLHRVCFQNFAGIEGNESLGYIYVKVSTTQRSHEFKQ